MTKPPAGLNPLELQRQMLEDARREVLDNEKKAARFSTVGSASDGSGDLIVVGRTVMGLTTVAVRINTVQALAICANVCGALSQAMQAAEAQAVKAPKA